MNALKHLNNLGQSIWYDNISREMLQRGELAAMVSEGLLGVTSNPTIFDKAISGSTLYDDQLRELVEADRSVSVETLIRELMVRDIQMAADVLATVYETSAGADGYVSIEVTPSKARDTEATIEEVRLLWNEVARPNLMVKIPATREGLPAIEAAIFEGMNINVTLIFSVERYREVFQTYMRGLERRLEKGLPLKGIASVASVFVSRVDTLVDAMLEERIKGGATQAGKLRGQAAVANAKMVYAAFQELAAGKRFSSLGAHGADLQRPLWGSTGTKNPAYSDLLYVQTLVGPHTVNTVPPQTYRAILDHLRPERTVDADLEEARRVLKEVGAAGVDLAKVMEKLEQDGVAAFERSFDGLYDKLRTKRDAMLGESVPQKS